ncbi:hypothetical protein Poly41_43990 [Novipirellula artificiosorum]|uniref:DUF1573 domain-containing protein n=2 Tax=Novipirellula artificiosorum TaxID=2528016 RepID=A0A5C6DBR3_9BACT|nr:hypothetical protein Poly41_43990 [Novipirellula artificiosorum]
MFLGGLSVCMAFGFAISLGAVVKNKPYGVPDHRRAEFEQKLRLLRQEQLAIEDAKKNSSPRVLVEQATFDFGFLAPGTNGASHDFVVKNVGEGDLVLSSGGTSCKCTIAEIEDRVVPAGQSRSVRVVWNVGAEVTDSYQQTALIETNDPTHETIELTVQGRIRSKWSVQAEDLMRLKGSIGQPLEFSCVLYSQLFDDFVVLDWEASSEKIQVEVQPIGDLQRVSLHARSGYKVNVVYAAPAYDASPFDETIRLNVFDMKSEETEWIEVPFRGRFGKPLVFHGPALDTSGLDLGTIEIGSNKEWSFFVRFKTDDRVTDPYIKSISPEGLHAAIEPIERVKNTYRVTLRVADDAVPTRFRFDKQGFVEVADRDHPRRSDWMPLFGEFIAKLQSP